MAMIRPVNPIPPALAAAALAAALALVLPRPAPAEGWPPGALIAGLSGDWNEDGLPDLAVLVAGQDDAADLLLYLGAERGLAEALRVPRAVFGGPMYGQTPGLQARSATSFMVTSEQTGIGRSPWSQQVTVAWRDGEFVVAGFTHGFYDRIVNDRFGRCDLNLLTGAWSGTAAPGEGKPERQFQGRDGPRAFPLSALTDDYFPDPCRRIDGD